MLADFALLVLPKHQVSAPKTLRQQAPALVAKFAGLTAHQLR
jgi:hypothetical protein